MSLVYIGIGSNVDREENIRSCIKSLHEKYSVISLSPLYETSSMGFDGPNFYNLVCCFETSQDVVVLKTELSVIEKNHGRSMNETKFSSRTLDIDILYYDDLIYEDDNLKLPRKEIIQYDFVLQPLVDIAPEFIHPLIKKTNKEIMDEFSIEKNIIKEIPINLDE
jgi:2-amino-4-hydroxy-6-hydroxymethyldihydropteridine diphosphokinase